MAEFRHRDLQSSDPAELRRQLNAELRSIEAELAGLRARGAVSSVQVIDYTARFGEVVRVAPPSTGLRVTLPPALLAQTGKSSRVVVVVEGEAGALTVEAVDATVNGVDTLTFAAGIGVVEFVLTEAGWHCWSATMVLEGTWTYEQLQQVSATARVLGRYSAAAGVIEEGTITQVLDLVGGTHGQVLFRGAAAWQVLSAGTAGRPLVTGGAGADPSFAQLGAAGIANGTVSNALMANMAANSFKLNNTAGLAAPIDGTVAQALALLGALSFVGLQVFTASGTYTPTTGMRFVLVIATGCGGGGGGADCTGAGDVAAGGGGGAGGTCVELFSAATIGASKVVTIGTAGSAGSNTGGDGGTGGDVTLGALFTATGGNGGGGKTAGADNVTSRSGGTGGVPTGGLLNVTGGEGQTGFALLTLDVTDTNEVALVHGGHGGASFWGGGGRGGHTAQDAANADTAATSPSGQTGKAFGSGGGGGGDANNATGGTGGAGQTGVLVAIEFG